MKYRHKIQSKEIVTVGYLLFSFILISIELEFIFSLVSHSFHIILLIKYLIFLLIFFFTFIKLASFNSLIFFIIKFFFFIFFYFFFI